MEAIAKNALETTSAIAIERSTSQKASAVVIPFPAPESREEVTANSIAVGEAMAGAMRETVEAGNDNSQPVEELPDRNALIERQHLASAFEIVSTVIQNRNTLPVLDNSRVTASGNLATITATDLDIEISVTVPAAIDGGFDVTIPAKKMKELLKGAPKADYVAFENAGESVAADFEKVRYRLNAIPAADFPVLAGPKDGACFMMRGADFADGLDAVAGAISTEEARYYLNGIFLESCEDGRELRMVATDGHRLYMQKLELPSVIGNWPVMGYQRGVIIPQKTVVLLSRITRGKKCPDFIGITVAESACRFVFSYEFGEVTITSKNIDGTFPDYRRVIPNHSNFPAARFDSAGLAEGIKAVSLISTEKGRAFKLSVNSDGAQLVVNNPDMGSAVSNVPCQWGSEPTEIGFNARYILDALDVAGDGEVSIYVQDASSPGVVIGKREGWLAVVMPMRV